MANLLGFSLRDLNHKKHGSYHARQSWWPFSKTFRLSEYNIFPEAVEMLATKITPDDEGFATRLVKQIEYQCQSLDDSTCELVDSVLSDFGHDLMIYEGHKASERKRTAELLQSLYAVDSGNELVKVILSIRHHCQEQLLS